MLDQRFRVPRRRAVGWATPWRSTRRRFVSGVVASVLAVALLAGCSTPSDGAAATRSSFLPIATGSGSPKGTTDSGHQHHHHQRPNPGPTQRPNHAGVPVADLPDHSLTPGVALPVPAARICVLGYASGVRDVSDSLKADVYARYGIAWVPYKYEVDHLISLELGGSNSIRNLWPEPYAGRWGARTKDALENRLHDLVCAGRLPLRVAQRQESRNWVAAYRRYVGAPPTTGSGGGSPASPGGFYASRYPTASTIYCADDPAWHELSPTYLVHFDTFAQATARFPSYHLHRPC